MLEWTSSAGCTPTQWRRRDWPWTYDLYCSSVGEWNSVAWASELAGWSWLVDCSLPVHDWHHCWLFVDDDVLSLHPPLWLSEVPMPWQHSIVLTKAKANEDEGPSMFHREDLPFEVPARYDHHNLLRKVIDALPCRRPERLVHRFFSKRNSSVIVEALSSPSPLRSLRPCWVLERDLLGVVRLAYSFVTKSDERFSSRNVPFILVPLCYIDTRRYG